MSNLAVYTFGILSESPSHSEVQGFFDLGEKIIEQVKKAPGLIKLVNTIGGKEVPTPSFITKMEHPERLLFTLSVWKDLESVLAFSYRDAHGQAFGQKWTVKDKWPTYVAWWIEDRQEPTPQDGTERLEYLFEYGSSFRAFNFQHGFDAGGEPIRLKRKVIEEQQN